MTIISRLLLEKISRRITSAADEKTKLAHELGHCITGAFYSIDFPFDIRQRHENRADKWAIKRLVPEKELEKAVADGYTEIWALADFFGVTEYEIRKAIKLAGLIPPLADILENSSRKLPIACAERIADYDADSQRAFVEMCTIEGYVLNKSTIQKIAHTCPPPSAEHQDIYAAWRQARADEEMRRTAPPKKIAFDRRKFAPYLDKLNGDEDLEELFLEFLRQRIG